MLIFISAMALFACSRSQKDTRYPASMPVNIPLWDFCEKLQDAPGFEGVVQEPIGDCSQYAIVPVLFPDGTIDSLFIDMNGDSVIVAVKVVGDDVQVEYK